MLRCSRSCGAWVDRWQKRGASWASDDGAPPLGGQRRRIWVAGLGDRTRRCRKKPSCKGRYRMRGVNRRGVGEEWGLLGREKKRSHNSSKDLLLLRYVVVPTSSSTG